MLIDLAPAPAFALDLDKNRIHAAWETAGGVLLSRSDDAGASFSPPQRMGPASGTQFLPGLGVASDGRVDVAFYDRSGDPDDVNGDDVMLGSHLPWWPGPGTTTVIWADAARGNRTNNIVDLMSTTVDVRAGEGARAPLVAAGAALIVAAIALFLPGSAAGRGRAP